jgi:hypothetical protein
MHTLTTVKTLEKFHTIFGGHQITGMNIFCEKEQGSYAQPLKRVCNIQQKPNLTLHKIAKMHLTNQSEIIA